MSFSIKNGIRSHDLFGHIIAINFNRKGSTHKTFIGGLISIFIKILMWLYLGSKLYAMFWRTNDTMSTVNYKLPELETLYYDELGVLVFWVLRKTKGKEENFFLTKEMEKYLHIEFL